MNYRDYFIQCPRGGKVLGAVLGFLMAGPLGAFLGILVGNFFDRGLSEHFSKPHWSFRAEFRKPMRDLFLKTTFSALGYIAKGDGRISPESITSVQTIMHEIELSATQQRSCQFFFNEGKNASFNIDPLLIQFNTAAQTNPELIKLFIQLQYQHLQQSGLSPGKVKRFNDMLNVLGFAALEKQSYFYDDFIEQHAYHHHRQDKQYRSQQHRSQNNQQSTPFDAYAILGITPDTSEKNMRQTYRRLISQHHPDKIIAKGGSEKEVKLANEKTQAIRKAYELICQQKGW